MGGVNEMWENIWSLWLSPSSYNYGYKVIVRKVARELSEELFTMVTLTPAALLHSIENPPPVVIVAFYLLTGT